MRSDAGSIGLLPESANRFFRAEHIVVHRGDTLLIPYGAGSVRITGSVSMVRCLPPSARL